MQSRSVALTLILVAGTFFANVAVAQVINDNFPGSTLGSDWSWNHMTTCDGSVNNGLILNPVDGSWRQSAIASTDNGLSWLALGRPTRYQFTISSWDISASDNVAARMYISTTDGNATVDPWDDYNNSNGVMAELSVNGGNFWWNLYQKEDLPGTSYNNDTYKLAFMDVGAAVDGYTFGFDLSGGNASLWYDDGAAISSTTGLSVATGSFNQDARVYVGVINGTGTGFDETQTVTFSNVAVIPEPAVGVLVLGGLLLLFRKNRRR